MRSRKKSKDTLKKLKGEQNNPKSLGHRESSPKGKIHSITSLSQDIQKISNKQSNFVLT